MLNLNDMMNNQIYMQNQNFYMPNQNMNIMQNQNMNMQNQNINMNMQSQNMHNQNINMNMQNQNMNMNIQNQNMNMNIQNQNMNMNIQNQNINEQNQNNINYILEENERLKKEIKELKLRLENGDFERKTKMVDYNKIRCVTFVSNDLQVICGLKCLITDTFAEVEEKLYKIYPEYRETNNIFQVNGKQILRFKTIEENNIQEGQGVQLVRLD